MQQRRPQFSFGEMLHMTWSGSGGFAGTASRSAKAAPAHAGFADPCYIHPQWISPSCPALVGFPVASSPVSKLHLFSSSPMSAGISYLPWSCRHQLSHEIITENSDMQLYHPSSPNLPQRQRICNYIFEVLGFEGLRFIIKLNHQAVCLTVGLHNPVASVINFRLS